ncbi:MAG: hypothetical protein KatS3mg051_1678 [Anaerolineae bacterium]|nr:MAG: hypothetical protein KatS3mg051_1678 [Anaerolineae bacterium]
MSVVDEVKARLDIVDVVSGYVHLQKAGRNFKALCPFHHEKTPSFVVFPETQTWRCFGACGEGGDIFSFVMKAEGWDFGEALRNLAKRAGVELAPLTPAQQQQVTEHERLQGLIEEAARFFHQQLLEAPAAEAVRAYVTGRGLRAETVAAFPTGLCAGRLAPGPAASADAGLHSGRDRRGGRRHPQRAGQRLRPLPAPADDPHPRCARARTVGFGARALDKDAVPKYLNSPQGPPLRQGAAALTGWTRPVAPSARPRRRSSSRATWMCCRHIRPVSPTWWRRWAPRADRRAASATQPLRPPPDPGPRSGCGRYHGHHARVECRPRDPAKLTAR